MPDPDMRQEEFLLQAEICQTSTLVKVAEDDITFKLTIF